MNRFLKWAVPRISLFALAACGTLSTKGNSGATPASKSGSGSYSQGLGKQASFQAKNPPFQANLHVPFNQSYYFDFDKTGIHTQYVSSIDAQANYLSTHPKTMVLVAGNTDQRGSREYNIGLGERRAQSIANLLEMDGVLKSQSQLVSYGAEKPVALGHTEAAYRKNRRVDLIYEAG